MRGAALVVSVGVLAVAVTGCSGNDTKKRGTSSTSTTSTTAPPATTTTTPGYSTPEAAIEAYLADRGHEYAGDCAGTDPATDVGKWCSASDPSDSADDGTKIYGIGPAFAEFAEELTLTRGSDGKWRVTGSTPAPSPGF